MFDLFRSRDKVVKIMLGGLLLVVALSMITYLVPSYTDPNFQSGDPVLARVGSKEITASAAMNQFLSQPQAQSLPPDLIQVYFPQFLDNMISQTAAAYQAEQMGLEITDEEMLVAMQILFADYFQDGKLISVEALDTALRSQGVTLQQATEEIRNQLLLNKVRDVVAESAVVTPQEVERAFLDKYERAAIDYIAFDSANMRDRIEITDAEARERFERDQALYTEPAKNTFRVAVLDQFQLESVIQVTEEELRDFYNASLENFRLPEQVEARHILVSDEDKAEDLKEQLDNGADFAELARENSEDGGTAESGGDLGLLVRGQTIDPAFEDAAFNLEAGEVSDVVQTQVGYHIIQATDKVPGRIQSFEEVRSLIESEARARVVSERMLEAAQAIRSGLISNPDQAAQIIARNNGQLVQVTEASAGDPIPTLGVTPEIDQALSALEPGGVTDILTLPADRMAIAILDDRIESRPSTFEEVEAEVRDRIFTERSTTIAADIAAEAAEAVRSGQDLEAVAREYGVDVISSNMFARADSIDGLGPAAYLDAAFDSPEGAILGPILVQNRNVVAVVTAKQEPDMTTLDFERDELVFQLKGTKAEVMDQLWQDSILAKLTADGEVERYEDQIQLVISQIR